MSAYEIPGLRFSLNAGADIARRRLISLNSLGQGVQSVAGQASLGSSMNDPKNNEVLTVSRGIVLVEAGGIVAINSEVESNADGKAIVLSTGKSAGVAMTAAAAAGELISVLIR